MKVQVTHFWDTRPHCAEMWKYNIKIYKHNVETMMRDLPADWEVLHCVMINEVAESPAVDYMSWWMMNDYNARVHRWKKKLSNKGHDHLVVWNRVATKAYEAFREEIEGADLIFRCGQDWVIANHYPENFFVVYHQLMDRSAHSRNEELGWYNQWGDNSLDQCDWISHTVRGGRARRPERFGHNGAIMYKHRRLGEMRESIHQLDQAQESHLGKVKGEKCLYLVPVPDFYFFITRHRGRGESEVLAMAQDRGRTMELGT